MPVSGKLNRSGNSHRAPGSALRADRSNPLPPNCWITEGDFSCSTIPSRGTFADSSCGGTTSNSVIGGVEGTLGSIDESVVMLGALSGLRLFCDCVGLVHVELCSCSISSSKVPEARRKTSHSTVSCDSLNRGNAPLSACSSRPASMRSRRRPFWDCLDSATKTRRLVTTTDASRK